MFLPFCVAGPNGPSQGAVIRAALARGRLDPTDVGYVELHGTGTSGPVARQACAATFFFAHFPVAIEVMCMIIFFAKAHIVSDTVFSNAPIKKSTKNAGENM